VRSPHRQRRYAAGCQIATDGAHVNQGDLVVQFDSSKTEQDLAQYQSTLKSAQAEMTERAQDVLRNGDTTAVLKAQYDVEAQNWRRASKRLFRRSRARKQT